MQLPALCGRTLLSPGSARRRLLTRSPRSSLHLLTPHSYSALCNLPPLATPDSALQACDSASASQTGSHVPQFTFHTGLTSWDTHLFLSYFTY